MPELSNNAGKIIPLEIMIALANLTVCAKTDSYFLTACSLYSLINVFVRGILFLGAADKKAEIKPPDSKKMYGRSVAGGFILLIASLGFLGCGILMFFKENQVINYFLAILILLLTGISLFFSIRCFLMTKNYGDVPVKTFSFLNSANAFVLLSLFVSVILYFSPSEETPQLIGMTGVVFGSGAAGLSGYILWDVLLTDERNQKRYHHFRNNSTIIFTRLTLIKDVMMVLGKVILSCITLSGFMFVNALYSAGMGIARYSAIRNQGKDQIKQIRGYFQIGAAIFGGSLCYVIYSIGMFGYRIFAEFTMNIALIIAAYTFTEFFLIIKDYIKARKNKNLISEEIKLIGLSSTLVCVVLTQAAIMSISYEGNASFFNSLSGVIFGSLAAMVGVYMMIRSRFLSRKLTGG